MTKPKIALIAMAWLFAVIQQVTLQGQSPADQVKPDNTKMNQRDRAPGAVTAGQQKMNARDRDITARIRRSIMADKSLYTYARNVKVISQDGTVTLKGPVHSDDEMRTIVARASTVTGDSARVVNQMSVTPWPAADPLLN